MKKNRFQNLLSIAKEYRISLFLFLSFLFPVMLVVFSNSLILFTYTGEISYYPNIPYDIGVVFGGGMKDKTNQTENQIDRVAVGTFLYKKGIISKIRLTGDDGNYKSNEIDYMASQSITMGVPIYAIEKDGTGYRTIVSCEHLVNDYQGKNVRILAISNGYHLPRISFLCKEAGIHVDTVPVEDVIGIDRKRSTREVFARTKALIEITQKRLINYFK